MYVNVTDIYGHMRLDRNFMIFVGITGLKLFFSMFGTKYCTELKMANVKS